MFSRVLRNVPEDLSADSIESFLGSFINELENTFLINIYQDNEGNVLHGISGIQIHSQWSTDTGMINLALCQFKSLKTFYLQVVSFDENISRELPQLLDNYLPHVKLESFLNHCESPNASNSDFILLATAATNGFVMDVRVFMAFEKGWANGDVAKKELLTILMVDLTAYVDYFAYFLLEKEKIEQDPKVLRAIFEAQERFTGNVALMEKWEDEAQI